MAKCISNIRDKIEEENINEEDDGNIEEAIIENDENANIVKEKLIKLSKAREKAKNGQDKQAKQMLATNKKQINSFKVDDKVLLHTEGIDRSSADPVNLLCIILEKKDILFKLGCEAGILDTYFAFNDLIC